MQLLDVLLTGVGLSMDASAVGMSNGLAEPEMKAHKVMLIALFYGVFQGVMPLIGYFASGLFADAVASVAPYMALILLGFIGGKMIFEAFKKTEEETALDCCAFSSGDCNVRRRSRRRGKPSCARKRWRTRRKRIRLLRNFRCRNVCDKRRIRVYRQKIRYCSCRQSGIYRRLDTRNNRYKNLRRGRVLLIATSQKRIYVYTKLRHKAKRSDSVNAGSDLFLSYLFRDGAKSGHFFFGRDVENMRR